VTLLPGLGFGERRSLGVRGFPPGSLLGTRALVGTVEYRAPLALLHRGIWWLPVFLDRGSVAVFADAGTAAVDRSLLPLQSDRLIASLGAELVLNVALQYDVPYVVRLGVGVPVQGRELTPADAALLYVRIGAAF
jgi:hemolysin activation/secretion protein